MKYHICYSNNNLFFLTFFQAIQIQEEADRLLQQHRDLMEDVDMQKRDAEGMLQNGIRQQQVSARHLLALWLISTAGLGIRFGLGIGFQTLWLHRAAFFHWLGFLFHSIYIVQECVSESESESESGNGNKPLLMLLLISLKTLSFSS